MKTPNIYIEIVVACAVEEQKKAPRIYFLSGFKTICSIIDCSKYNIQIQEQRD